MSKITNVRLPNASGTYDPSQFNQLVRSLEQIILQLNNTYASVVDQDQAAAASWFAGGPGGPGQQGVQGILLPYGAFQDSTDQVAANTTTAYPMTLNTTDYSNGVYLSNGSRMNVRNYGVYNLQFSTQFVNTDSQIHDIDIWFRKNGTNIAYSNSRYSVPNSQSCCF